MTTDERQGKPSASGIERLSLCAGSWNLERTLPPLPESEDAGSGTRIHRALELNDATGLKDEEGWVYDRCRELRDEALTTVFHGTTDLHLGEELRGWFQGRFSGKSDLIATTSGLACILDYKTGRNDVTTAEGNAQLRALAIIVQEKQPFRGIVVGVIQPWAKEPISLCEYTRADLSKAREWLIAVLDAAEKPDAPRIPGEKQCRWCRAKAVCAEAQSAALAPPLINTPVGTTPAAIAATLTGPTLGSFLNRASFAESVIEACRDEAKRRLAEGEEVPGWKLKEGATREVITDPEGVFTRFSKLGGDSSQFLPCVEVKKTKLKDALKSLIGLKGKELDKGLAVLLDGLTESKQNAPSLERVKE